MADNFNTIYSATPMTSWDPYAAFQAAWGPVREHLLDRPPATLVVGFDPDARDVRVLGIEAPGAIPRDILIGRHSACDVRFDSEAVSLRHTLLRVVGCRDDQGRDATRVRLIDLCTRDGMRDGVDRRCRGLAGQRHLTAGLAGCTVFVLDVQALAPLVDDREAAWQQIQEDRACVQISGPIHASEWRPAPAPGATVPPESSLFGPTMFTLGATVCEDAPDASVGRLELVEAGVTRAVSELDLVSGVLVGRTERCALFARAPRSLDSIVSRLVAIDRHEADRATGEEPAMHAQGDPEDPPFRRLSRVHLLVLKDSQGIWAIDTASQNGTRLGTGEPFRTLRLEGGERLSLGGSVWLRWESDVH